MKKRRFILMNTVTILEILFHIGEKTATYRRKLPAQGSCLGWLEVGERFGIFAVGIRQTDNEYAFAAW